MNITRFIESLDRHKETKESNTRLKTAMDGAMHHSDAWVTTMNMPISSRFVVHYHHRDPNVMLLSMYGNPGIETIELDNEDLEYLYNKYYPKVEEELREKNRKEVESLESKVEASKKELERALDKLNAKKVELNK